MRRLSEEDFKAWRTGPVTQMVRKYLKHREGRLRQEWAQGREWTPESRAVVDLLSDLEDIQFGDIVEFYGTLADDRGEIEIPDIELSLYPEDDDDADNSG